MLLNIWQRCRHVRFRLLLLLLIILIDAFLATFSITMIMPITNAAIGAGDDMAWLTGFLPEHYRDDISFLIFCLAAALALKFLVTIIRTVFSIKLSEGLRKGWQIKLNRQYIYRPYKDTVSERKGGLINNLIKETDAASSFVLNYLGYLTQLTMILAILSLLVSVNWQWLAIGGVIAALAYIFAARPYFRLGRRLGQRNIKLNQNLNSVMYESLCGIKDIKISNSENFQTTKVEELAEDVRHNRTMKKMAQAVPTVGNDLVLASVMIFVALTIPDDLNEIKGLMPQIALFVAAITRLASITSTLASLRFKVMAKYPCFILVTGELENSAAQPENIEDGNTLDKITDTISLRDVVFRYDEDTPVFVGLDLDIELGKTICISGPSGAGKTTLIDMLARLYSPDSGHICVGDTGVADYKLADWRRLVGYVPQEPIIYYGSVRENITLGQAGISDEEIKRAAQLSSAAEFIDGMTNGYDTLLTECGSNLSGGQKKRIAIARAIAQKAQILILDEATGAIQEEAEKELIEKLQGIDGLTIIIISHRSNTAELADVCYHIENGKAQRTKG